MGTESVPTPSLLRPPPAESSSGVRPHSVPTPSPLRPYSVPAYEPLRTVLIERVRQVGRDVIRGAAFDLVTLEHVDDLAVLEQSDLR